MASILVGRPSPISGGVGYAQPLSFRAAATPHGLQHRVSMQTMTGLPGMPAVLGQHFSPTVLSYVHPQAGAAFADQDYIRRMPSLSLPNKQPQNSLPPAWGVQPYSGRVASLQVGAAFADPSLTALSGQAGRATSFATSFQTAEPPPNALGATKYMLSQEESVKFNEALQALGTLPTPIQFAEPYEAILDYLVRHGFLKGLPADAEGVLHVNVPFCSSLSECPVLCKFLAHHFLETGAFSGVAVAASDITDLWRSNTWDDKEHWVQKTFPGMNLQLKQADLSCEMMPQSGLTIAAHPEASTGGLWNNIVANVVRSMVPGGLCVFACFHDQEVEHVIRMCKNSGVSSEISDLIPNPYWEGRPIPQSPYFRYFILVRRN